MKKVAQKGFSVIELLILMVVVLVIGLFGWKIYQLHIRTNIDTTYPPQFVTADFIDLSKVFSISKFRSLQGHDFSGGGETCRSMKHYFTPQMTQISMLAKKNNNGLPPRPDGKTDTDIFSPFDGKITRIDSERTPIGEQIFLVPDAAPQYTVRLFHVFKDNGITVGVEMKAGQKIGVIGEYQDTDISVEAGNKFISIFQVMTDKVFNEYRARGAKTRDDFIISREYRDAHAVTCNQDKYSDQSFNLPANYDQNADAVHLSGYIAPPKPQTGNNVYYSGNPQPGQNYSKNVAPSN